MQNKPLSNYQPGTPVEKLQALDIRVGTGEIVEPNATVTAHYTGAVADTGIVFQSSHDAFGDKPISFPLNGVISGWSRGVPGMRVGGIRRLYIPSELAYGAVPPPGSGIPPHAALIFDIELTAVQNMQ